jgi:hypothetical protein
LRVVQPEGTRGSLKWIQRLINDRPEILDSLIAPFLTEPCAIEWVSPRRDDDFAEYRDASFLTKVGARDLAASLGEFWPARGPQWDALGKSNGGDIFLVEAKAHIPELFSPPTQASAVSREKIERALADTIATLGATPRAPWTEAFFQYANRLAHLDFLRRLHGRKAWLIFVYFVGDAEMKGPITEAEWRAALPVVKHVLGIPETHVHARHVIEVFPPVNVL